MEYMGKGSGEIASWGRGQGEKVNGGGSEFTFDAGKFGSLEDKVKKTCRALKTVAATAIFCLVLSLFGCYNYFFGVAKNETLHLQLSHNSYMVIILI